MRSLIFIVFVFLMALKVFAGEQIIKVDKSSFQVISTVITNATQDATSAGKTLASRKQLRATHQAELDSYNKQYAALLLDDDKTIAQQQAQIDAASLAGVTDADKYASADVQAQVNFVVADTEIIP